MRTSKKGSFAVVAKDIFDEVFLKGETLDEDTIVSNIKDYLNSGAVTEEQLKVFKRDSFKNEKVLKERVKLYISEFYASPIETNYKLTASQKQIIGDAVEKVKEPDVAKICDAVYRFIKDEHGEKFEFYSTYYGFCTIQRMSTIIDYFLIDTNYGNVQKNAFCFLF